MRLKSYNHTISACIIGYIVQAIVNNFITLLFIYFHGHYNLSLDKLATISAFNFLIQLTVDMLSPHIAKVIGCRMTAVFAHIFAGCGILMLTILPDIFSPYFSILISSMVYAIGGGLIEVMVSPIVEVCPTPADKKAAIMSLLHSFYSWGQLAVILLSTVFFFLFGIENWRIIAYFWAGIPLLNAFYFMIVPIISPPLGEKGMSLKQLLSYRSFRLFLILMLCAGTCELGIAQWASAYGESALKLSKTTGDLAVPCIFALLMGISRVFYSKFSIKLNLEKYMTLCAVLCLTGYALAMVSPIPIIGIIGCAICGFAVGVLWPGTYSVASKDFPSGGIVMFSYLALAGDMGCSIGPALIGFVSGRANGNLKLGMIVGVFFSALLLVTLVFKQKSDKCK